MKDKIRGAILPDTGDPFVLGVWMDCFKRWEKEIDVLYFVLNSPISTTVRHEIERMIEPYGKKIHYMYNPSIKDHGDGITEALAECETENVMLVENDGIIFKPGIVDECFSLIEKGEYDVVGSDRGSATMGLVNAGLKRFGIDKLQHADRMPHFWPNFFFTKRKILEATDRHFTAKGWKNGEYIKELDWIVKEDNQEETAYSDTFVWASIQILAKSPKVKYIDQYHAYVEDPMFKREGKHLWDGKCKWLHYGSVSTGMMGLLCDDTGMPLMFHGTDKGKSVFSNGTYEPNIVQDSNRGEYERRCAYFWLCAETQRSKGLSLQSEYEKAIWRFVDHFGLHRQNIIDRAEMYRNLIQL